jgi:hypothetical protein
MIKKLTPNQYTKLLQNRLKEVIRDELQQEETQGHDKIRIRYLKKDLKSVSKMSVDKIIEYLQHMGWDVESAMAFLINAVVKDISAFDLNIYSGWST